MQRQWTDSDELRRKLAQVREIEGQRKDHCTELYRRPGHQRRMEIVRSVLQHIVAGRDFLDIGCAEGVYCGMALELGARRVVGIDVSPSKIERAKEQYPTCQFHCADVFQMEDLAGQFDAVVCSELLQHVTDYLLAARCVIDCLRPGGHAVFTAPNLSETSDHIPASISPDMTVEQLVGEIGGAGFGRQNAVWKFNTDKLYDEIVEGSPGAKLLEKIPVDTPDGQKKNLWTVGVIEVGASSSRK